MIEYHVYTDTNENYEQAYVFLVDRDEDGKVNMQHMYTTTVMQNNGEVRTKVNMNKILNEIINNVGGNINKKNADTIFNIFGDLIPQEIIEQTRLEVMADDFDYTTADMLIRASEAAESAHPTDFETTLKNLKK